MANVKAGQLLMKLMKAITILSAIQRSALALKAIESSEESFEASRSWKAIAGLYQRRNYRHLISNGEKRKPAHAGEARRKLRKRLRSSMKAAKAVAISQQLA